MHNVTLMSSENLEQKYYNFVVERQKKKKKEEYLGSHVNTDFSNPNFKKVIKLTLFCRRNFHFTIYFSNRDFFDRSPSSFLVRPRSYTYNIMHMHTKLSGHG